MCGYLGVYPNPFGSENGEFTQINAGQMMINQWI